MNVAVAVTVVAELVAAKLGRGPLAEGLAAALDDPLALAAPLALEDGLALRLEEALAVPELLNDELALADVLAEADGLADARALLETVGVADARVPLALMPAPVDDVLTPAVPPQPASRPNARPAPETSVKSLPKVTALPPLGKMW